MTQTQTQVREKSKKIQAKGIFSYWPVLVFGIAVFSFFTGMLTKSGLVFAILAVVCVIMIGLLSYIICRVDMAK